MTFYSSVFVLTEVMMIAMTLHVFFYTGFTKVQKAWFILTFGTIFFCALAEYSVHCGYYDKAFDIPLTILTVIQFSVAPIIGILFVGALGIHQKKLAFIYLAINLIVEIVAAPFGWIFYFNDDGYHRGNLFFIYGIFYFSSLIYLLISMLIVGKRFRNRDKLTAIMIIVVLAAGILPMTFYKINITYLAIAISSILCYIYYNDLVQHDIQEELVINQERISNMQVHMISGMANLIENRDLETGEHITRTSEYVKKISELTRKDGFYKDEITDHFIELIYTLAPMHDIGKIIIPDSILKKPGKLTKEEFEVMKTHASVGGNLVRDVLAGITDDEYISFAEDIVTYHHERWDGTGYPKKLKEEEIPLSARIMAIADVFDALVSERCYKKAMTPDEAFKIIEEESGTHFDPTLVKVFLNHKNDFEMILRKEKKSKKN
ncbi:MAG: HD domain-containing protein [Acholeplasmatales bacterium]|nr:HD domain-containing protein [Acholeplasmatales bacterium]